GAFLAQPHEPDVGQLAQVVRAGRLADPELLGERPDGGLPPGHRDGVQQPHPHRFGQAGEPLRVRRRIPCPQLRRLERRLLGRHHGQRRGGTHARQYRRTSMIASIDGGRYSPAPSIDPDRWSVSWMRWTGGCRSWWWVPGQPDWPRPRTCSDGG